MSVVFRLFHFSRANLLSNLNSSRSASSICTVEDKQNLVKRLLEAKLDSGLTFDEIASRCQITNVHCAQLFHNQARLSPKLAATLKQLVPALQDDDLREMQRCPLRIADPLLMHDPAVYRFHELVVQRRAKVENDALSFEWTANFCPVLNQPSWISAKIIFSIRFH
ncbi:Cyanate hydratase [Trichinella spiralis]|uniref:Cyanate hydratase n=1 Tax=Trichinella spiralis TaxID=6334 RepID=A0ABR3K0R7_TRISP